MREKTKVNTRDTWDRLWSQRIRGSSGSVKINLYNKFILNKLSEIVQLNSFSIVELGAGSGKLSYLMRSIAHAKHVTMVDRSAKAIEYSKYLFNSIDGAEWCEQDLFEHQSHYDLAISVGLLEHFKEAEQMKVVEAHASLAPRVAIVVPACSVWHYRRMQSKKTIQKYGWQLPYFNESLG